MMKPSLLIALVFVKTVLASPPLYILGDDSLLFLDSKASGVLAKDMRAKSSALDPDRCRLWIADEESHRLMAFEKGVPVQEEVFSGTIVSDFSRNHFMTLSEEGILELRNENGKVISTFPKRNSDDLRRLHLLSAGESWGLFQERGKREKLWLAHLNKEGQETKRVSLNPTDEFWGNAQLFVDELRETLWVAYSTKSPHHAYAPRVEKFSLSGTRDWAHQWDERGFFFDGCVSHTGAFLFARDLPTSPYTVPDYSFIEKFEAHKTSKGNPEQVLELETNRLVDSMACSENSIYFATHSIFGSEPRQILRWSGKNTELPELHFTLSFNPRKIFACSSAL